MLKKLSLAALIAMGGVSFATATPLTDAIKNVDFGGYLRLRVYNESDKTYTQRYRTTALFKFSVPVSEELKFNTAYAFDWNIYSDGTTDGSNLPANAKFFLQYSANGLNAIVGKIPVATPITATGVGEATAAGAIATYKVNDNITVAAAGLDAMVGLDQVGTGGNNVYAAAVIFAQDNIKAQAWYFNVDNMIDSDVVLRADYKMDNIALHADYAQADLTKSAATTLGVNDKTQTYFNVSAKYNQDALCAQVGYAQTGKDGGVVTLDSDSPLAAVLPTAQKYYITNTTDTNAVYGKVGYSVDKKTKVYAAAAVINDDTAANKDYQEYQVGVKYAYTKKMNIHAYYSILDGSNGVKNDDNNEARVEFKYSF
ncbi:hypothetical protein JCM11957_16840 [Caminibacter profundus]